MLRGLLHDDDDYLALPGGEGRGLTGGRGGHGGDAAGRSHTNCCSVWRWDWGLCAVMGLMVGLWPFTAHHHGFYERDFALSYPYTPDSEAHCPAWLLFVVCCALVPISLAVLQFTLKRAFGCTSVLATNYGLVQLAYWQSFLANMLATEALKTMNGRPRPNFFAMCNYAHYHDATQGPEATRGMYWDWYVGNTTSGMPGNTDKCRVTADRLQRIIGTMFASFPSGHSSMSMCSLGFFALVVLHAWPFSQRRNRLWKLLLAFIPLGCAGAIASSRTLDYWHNFSDIATGSILGMSIAGFVFYAAFLSAPSAAILGKVERLQDTARAGGLGGDGGGGGAIDGGMLGGPRAARGSNAGSYASLDVGPPVGVAAGEL